MDLSRSLAILKGRAQYSWRPSELAVSGDADGLQSFAQWCTEYEGARCVLRLSGSSVLTSVAPTGLDADAAYSQAVQQWAHYLDLDEAALQADWVLRQVTLPAVSVVCAAPRALIEALQDHASEHAIKLDWVGPAWAPAVQTWLATLRCEEQAEIVHRMRLPEAGWETHIEAAQLPGQAAHLTRVWVEKQGDAPMVVQPSESAWKQTWTATRTRPWADELDFVGPRIRTASWGWALLLAGLLAVAWVLPQVTEVDVAQAEAQLTLKRLQRAAHQQAIALKAPKQADHVSAQGPALTAEMTRHAAQLAQRLAYPWSATLHTIDEAAHSAHAVMLSLNLDLTAADAAKSSADIRLSAAVQDDASALRWVQAQGPSAQLLSRQRLGVPLTTASGQYDWRADATVSGAP
ncbi:MAG: hypothetical protein Q7U28_14000 [Aquabacterium sp.]|nr:hypothetical protein [Aquabacterium sp.]